MKKEYTKSKISLAAIMVITLTVLVGTLIFACKKPTDGINILVDSQSLTPAPTLVFFQNADSTSTNQPGDFAVSISGPGAAMVQMLSGGINFQASHGILSLSLIKGATPSISNPVSFTVTAQVTGFAPFIQNITITQNVAGFYAVKAIDYSTSAAGTTLLKTTEPLSAGTIAAPVTVTTPKNSSVTETATIAFTAGTQLQDVNKAAINASSVSLNVVQLSAANNALTNDFPGGLYAPDALDQTGTSITGGVSFVPAGLLSITMTAGGVAVKNLSKPVNVSMELSSSMTNFTTGAAIKVGDIIPYWSQNDLTGQWKYEGNATVVLDGNGKLSATIPITHLSNWCCAWFWCAATVKGASFGTCGNSLTANLTTTGNDAFEGGAYTVYLLSAYGNIVAVATGGNLHNGSSVTFQNTPSMPQAQIAVYYQGKPVVTGPLFNTCSSGGSVNVALSASAIQLPDPVNASISISGVCTTKQITVLPSAPFQLYQQVAGATTFQPIGAINVVNGQASTQLQTGSTYYLATYYNNTYYQTGNFTVVKGVIVIPPLSGFNVSTTYDAASNTLSLLGTIPINCN